MLRPSSTRLGGIDGEFCPKDRALIFEDPNGTRVLYNPGRTAAGATDPRLSKIDILLVSHVHGDELSFSFDEVGLRLSSVVSPTCLTADRRDQFTSRRCAGKKNTR